MRCGRRYGRRPLYSWLPNSRPRVRAYAKKNRARENAREALADDALRDDFLVAAELRLALEQIGLITGRVHTDDLLDRIFSRFCIGK